MQHVNTVLLSFIFLFCHCEGHDEKGSKMDVDSVDRRQGRRPLEKGRLKKAGRCRPPEKGRIFKKSTLSMVEVDQ